MLALVKLEALAARKPDKLSGGQQQRVALARALVKRPKLLLLDEPLAALDKKLREHTQFELANLQYQLGTTFVVVTHDQDEAMVLASRIAVMAEGRIAQVGTPGEVYEYPGEPPRRKLRRQHQPASKAASPAPRGGSGLAALRSAQCRPRGALRRRDRRRRADQRRRAAREDHDQPRRRRMPSDRNVVKGIVRDLGYFGDQSLYRVRLQSGAVLQVSAQNLRRTAKPDRRVGRRGVSVLGSGEHDPAALMSITATSNGSRQHSAGCAAR